MSLMYQLSLSLHPPLTNKHVAVVCFSDIDMVVFGKWDVIPIHTLEKELLDNNIADGKTIKVLDKASVSTTNAHRTKSYHVSVCNVIVCQVASNE